MELNADFSKRVAVDAAEIPWKSSPIVGVDRRMLDRIGDEVARATTIVRFAPNSHFSAHTHGGGEEFLVLDGVFQDEHGEYPAGCYVRNPPTSAHTPRSDDGCVILVKLWQFDPTDRQQVRIDTEALEASPDPERPGIASLALYADDHEQVEIQNWAPDSGMLLDAPHGLELFVLAGELRAAAQVSAQPLAEHAWLRLPAGDRLRLDAGPQGARVWIKRGHLLEPRGLNPSAARP
ncbi:MAG: cupin domain-containing protein [Gammaproteobacteria bacterium]|nr:cupin domain-containing protein [Gammaproteobacteria bacterium]